MSLEEIKAQALKLPPDDRETLAQELWQSLEKAPLDPEFMAMLDRRWEEIATGKVQTVSHEEVMANAREAVKKVREKKALSSKS
jgi:putative addiction module component (TIGR02574 family)